MTPNDFEKRFDVSRETMERLEHLDVLLKKWNPKINLVSPATLKESWGRHIWDSAQIYGLASEKCGKWLDIGSGGGFPGLVVAILNAGEGNPWDVAMMESDVRKCTFLRTVLRETSVKAEVITSRIEEAEPANADVLSARALTDLTGLCEFSVRHLKADGLSIFPKGVSWKKEVQTAEKSWSFASEVIKSETQEGAVILKVRDITGV
ncbi:16S rRNA (guanine(527)-N(7))-methyltransferase RsmG [Cognatishimia activa]|uniref:Ribosomal RNA small subunit methyltransferase G n=1 Tax=Cognatishimia activa TaxID=1715691 RepID=A0A0P1ILU5_9RHOB|nr:16S rRNA (guanine(527)-N(7))-methyltransferase RsmG [Cognatishimia activa]CUI41479.1 Ribosomal RNA small subunit methyltransferase G [Cognatishimia activa]CUK24578.1 Ribosomal RNA small subunit methyltransferase G [Cognatishimia activa]